MRTALSAAAPAPTVTTEEGPMGMSTTTMILMMIIMIERIALTGEDDQARVMGVGVLVHIMITNTKRR